MQALKALVPRHQPIVAAPHAAEIARLARVRHASGAIPPSAIAAREHHQRAQLQVAQLRQQGIVVLDEPDDKLDRAVLDAYLTAAQPPADLRRQVAIAGPPRLRPNT